MISFDWLSERRLLCSNVISSARPPSIGFMRPGSAKLSKAMLCGSPSRSTPLEMWPSVYRCWSDSGSLREDRARTDLDELPAHIEPFIEDWLNRRKQGYSESQRSVAARELRNPIRQLLHLILPNHGKVAGVPDPFVDAAPGFFDFLRRERGLRETTLVQYRHYLQRLQDYLRRFDRPLLPDLPPAVISALITESGKTLDKRSVQSLCSILKVFFRYLYRVGLMTRDLAKAIESPRRYQLSNLPRSIAWTKSSRCSKKSTGGVWLASAITQSSYS